MEKKRSATASGEDYLEAVLVLQKEKGMVRSVDVARHMGVSKPSVCHAVVTLKKGGFLTMDEDLFLRLTDIGREVAEQTYEKHCFFTHLLMEAGVEPEIKALVPISGDIAPMVYVNDTLYQIVDSQPNFADEKSSFNLLGKIENTVSSSEEPKENFQANDDIVGAAVYQYGDNIVVEFEGKYWLYEHYHNTDFDGNSD